MRTPVIQHRRVYRSGRKRTTVNLDPGEWESFCETVNKRYGISGSEALCQLIEAENKAMANAKHPR